MRKQFVLAILFFFLTAGTAMAQKKVSGVVTSGEDGAPIPGASISEKGTTNAVLTDLDGKFAIQLKGASPVIVVSFVGMKTEEIVVGQQSQINVTLNSAATDISGVVVTALGIKRQEKSLSYVTQQIQGHDLTAIPTVSVMNSLTGKAAGVTVSPSTSGVGSSSKVILRGYTSIQGNNQPMYVVDGMPLVNYIPMQAEEGNGFGGGVDVGDGISNLNFDDIENVSILKGASAAALYGSQAANGVILITTKSGKAGKTKVNFSTSLMFDKANILYKFENKYGPNGTTNWGTEKSFTDTHVADFFQTGVNSITSLAISGGNEKYQNYLSYGFTTSKGVVPTNSLNRHVLNFKNTMAVTDRLSITSKANFVQQNMNNPISAPGEYFNPIKSLYLFPQGNDFGQYKTEFEKFSVERNMMLQNWYTDESGMNNPYWILNRIVAKDKRTQAAVKIDANYKLTSWLSVKARGSVDKSWDDFERKVYAGTQLTNAHKNGRYDVRTNGYTQYYGDILLGFDKNFNGLTLNATLGSSIEDKRFKESRFDSDNKGLYYANLFSVPNMIDGGKIRYAGDEHSQIQSVFGTASFGYSDMLFLDITGRNDWSSTLPAQNRSYFYPSVGVSFLLSEALKRSEALPAFLSFAKLRASYAEVGHDIPPYVFNPTNSITETGTLIKNVTEPNPNIRPERTKEFEVGADIRMLESRLNLDISYYKSNTVDQYFVVSNPSGTGYSYKQINGGNIQNSGVELMLSGVPVRNNGFEWTSTINFAKNKSKVIELPEQYKENGYKLSSGSFSILVKEGGEYGEMWGSAFERKDGKLVVIKQTDGSYTPRVAKQDVRLGSVNPNFRLGWNNRFTYRGIALNCLIDGTFGGKVMSNTQYLLSNRGISQETADARDNKGVQVDAIEVDADGKTVGNYTGKIDAKTYYTGAPVGEYVYDGTNVRLRELSLGYTLPTTLMSKIKHVKSMTLSLVGRNLLFFVNKAPYDPETTVSTTGNYMLNTDNFGIPTTRSYGVTLNVNF